jgi:hypothetical protein
MDVLRARILRRQKGRQASLHPRRESSEARIEAREKLARGFRRFRRT